jgi:hypothetical protein
MTGSVSEQTVGFNLFFFPLCGGAFFLRSLPLAPILSQINPVNPLMTFFLCLGLPSGLFLSGFPTEILYTFLAYPMHTKCCIHIITIIIFGKKYKL